MRDRLRPWTSDELADLRRAYATEPVKAIAARLNRSYSSVRMMAAVERLAKPRGRRPRPKDA